MPKAASVAGKVAVEDSVGAYLADIARYPLLTKADEVRLGRRVAIGRAAQARLECGDAMTAAEKGKLRRSMRDGLRAAEEFTQSNLRLVVSIAKRYQATGVPLLDLIQEGNIGLMHAVELFDPEKGFKFSTYATNWIRQSISRGIANTSRTVRLPVHASDLHRNILEARSRLYSELGRRPSVQELADYCATTPEMVADVLRFGSDLTSLDAPIGEDMDLTVADRVGDAGAVSPEEAAVATSAATDVRRLLDQLDERERWILAMRFGIGDDVEKTLDEIGDRLRLSRERIRQIEKKAMCKLRHPTSGFDPDVLAAVG
ncbi:MAG: polymerase nonessential primary-like sigma factor [Acidimicrobiaceae bacterium]